MLQHTADNTDITHKVEQVNALEKKIEPLIRAEQFQEAIPYLEQSLKILPGNFAVWYNLGLSWAALNDTPMATKCYKRALSLCPDFNPALQELGLLYTFIGKSEKAINAFSTLLKHDPENWSAHYFLGILKQEKTKYNEAAVHFEKASKINDRLEPRLGKISSFPIILTSKQQAAQLKETYLNGLEKLITEVTPRPGHPICFTTSCFYIGYQAGNPRPYQEKLSSFYRTAYHGLNYTAAHVENWQPKKPGEKIRIGIISKYLTFEHAVAWTYEKIVTVLLEENFEVFILDLANAPKSSIPYPNATIIKMPANYSLIRQKTESLKLDILLFTDIGMEAVTYFTAYSRLAPIQCNTLGHPITSGISTIDYYLTNTLLEGPKGQESYTEKMICLPGVPSCYKRPPIPQTKGSPSDFSLPENKNYYLCLQTLYKLHPNMDDVFLGILEKDPNGILITIETKPGYKDPLFQRWSKTLARVLPQIHMLASQTFENYLRLVCLGDVMLDSFPFGGGNTSYQGFAAETPIVTWPDDYARGRGTLSLYKKMGFEDGVVNSAQEYIDLAVRLGTDKAFNAAFRKKISQHNHKIFNDTSVAQGFAEFFEKVARGENV